MTEEEEEEEGREGVGGGVDRTAAPFWTPSCFCWPFSKDISWNWSLIALLSARVCVCVVVVRVRARAYGLLSIANQTNQTPPSLPHEA